MLKFSWILNPYSISLYPAIDYNTVSRFSRYLKFRKSRGFYCILFLLYDSQCLLKFQCILISSFYWIQSWVSLYPDFLIWLLWPGLSVSQIGWSVCQGVNFTSMLLSEHLYNYNVSWWFSASPVPLYTAYSYTWCLVLLVRKSFWQLKQSLLISFNRIYQKKKSLWLRLAFTIICVLHLLCVSACWLSC